MRWTFPPTVPGDAVGSAKVDLSAPARAAATAPLARPPPARRLRRPLLTGSSASDEVVPRGAAEVDHQLDGVFQPYASAPRARGAGLQAKYFGPEVHVLHMGEGDFFWQRLEPNAIMPVKPKRAPGEEDERKTEQAASALLSITGAPKKPKLASARKPSSSRPRPRPPPPPRPRPPRRPPPRRPPPRARPARRRRSASAGATASAGEPPGPAARYGHAAVSLDDDTMWIFGGRGRAPSSATRGCSSCRTAARPSATCRAARSGAAATRRRARSRRCARRRRVLRRRGGRGRPAAGASCLRRRPAVQNRRSSGVWEARDGRLNGRGAPLIVGAPPPRFGQRCLAPPPRRGGVARPRGRTGSSSSLAAARWRRRRAPAGRGGSATSGATATSSSARPRRLAACCRAEARRGRAASAALAGRERRARLEGPGARGRDGRGRDGRARAATRAAQEELSALLAERKAVEHWARLKRRAAART